MRCFKQIDCENLLNKVQFVMLWFINKCTKLSVWFASKSSKFKIYYNRKGGCLYGRERTFESRVCWTC